MGGIRLWAQIPTPSNMSERDKSVGPKYWHHQIQMEGIRLWVWVGGLCESIWGLSKILVAVWLYQQVSAYTTTSSTSLTDLMASMTTTTVITTSMSCVQPQWWQWWSTDHHHWWLNEDNNCQHDTNLTIQWGPALMTVMMVATSPPPPTMTME